MITERIQALFIFIEFLHSKIERFKQFDNVMKDLQILQIQRNELNPRKNFAEKIKYDQVQAELEQKVDIISENVIQVINTKALELNIYDFKKPETIWNWNVAEIGKLKEDFSEDDIPVILEHKHKYIEYRAKTQFTYFNDIFFDYLDELLKELFDFFKESNENEFEAFEAKIIQVNDIEEALEQFAKGQRKFKLPIDILNFNDKQQSKKEALQPQDIITGDLASVMRDLQDLDKKNHEQLIKGFQGLETYINKNVFENVGADLTEIKKLNRELVAWKHQIKSVFVEPVNGETEFYNSDYLNQNKKQAIVNIQNKISGALEVLQLRINDKEKAIQNINTFETETTQSQQIKEKLLQYNFAEFINTKGFDPAKIEKLLTLIVSNELPYRIALVKELGYVEYFTKEYCQTKEEMYKLIGKIFTASERRIKGNILVLDPYSKEDRNTYTSHKYKEQVTKDIKGL